MTDDTLRTKWEILDATKKGLLAAYQKVIDEMRGMEETVFSGGPCGGCGAPLETEADFARHFVIFDERLRNLGECPVEVANDTLPHNERRYRFRLEQVTVNVPRKDEVDAANRRA